MPEELEKLLKLLEADSAEIHNLPDEEFQSAYMAFRSRAEQFIQNFLPDGIWNILCSQIQGLLNLLRFFFNERVDAAPRNADTWSLDPGAFLHLSARPVSLLLRQQKS